MKKHLFLLSILSISFLTSYSQIKLSLLDGKQIKLESYVFHNYEGYIDYSIMKKNGKLKNSYADFDDIYSINLNGVDSIMYQQLVEEEYTIDEMSRIVIARQNALNEYKPWWAFASGLVVGCGSLFLPVSGMTYMLVPIVYTASMAFVRPSNSIIRKRHEAEFNDDLYVYGYRSTGRKKIFKNTTLGVVGGIFVSGIILSTLYLTTEE